MSEYREERIEMIVAMMVAIANISEQMAFELLKSTITYQNIMDGEECTLYESYSANLEDVVEELLECNKGELVSKITEDEISKLNRWMLDKGIKNARQLKDNINEKHLVIAVAPNGKAINQKPYMNEFVTVRKKGAKTYGRVAASKAANTLQTQKKAGRVACKTRTNSSKAKKNESGWRVR